MKKLIIFLQIIIFCCSLSAQRSGWFFQNPANTNLSLNYIKFLTPSVVIADGYYGTLLRSTDAGISWSNPLNKSTATGLENLIYWKTSFINSVTGFIIGNNAGSYTKVYKTTNGGIFWMPVKSFIGIGETVQFINESTGWASSGLRIFRTTNGGMSWDSTNVSFPSSVRDIVFTNDLTGYTCMYRRTYKSTDGGALWSIVDSINYDYSNLFFLNSNTGFSAGSLSPDGSLIRKTTNGGLNWSTKLSNPLTGIISSIIFLNNSTGFAAGGGYYGPPGCIYKTTDSGESWQIVFSGSKFHINSITFSGSVMLASSYSGRILRSTDAGNSWMETSSFSDPGSSFNSVCFIDANTGWVCSVTGIIYRTVNGGNSWQKINADAPYQIDKLSFFNANTGYYSIGKNIYKTTNGGFNWSAMSFLNINSSNVKIDFYDINTAYAYGSFGITNNYSRILKSTNGAMSWDTINCVYNYCTSVTALKFVNEMTGFINVNYCLYPMGYMSSMYKTTNKGASWSFLRSDSGITYNLMDFSDANTGWALKNNKVLSTYDGGNTWNTQILDGVVNSFNMVNASTGWINTWSYGNRLYKTTNSGVNWYLQIDLGLSSIYQMSFINANTGWVAGSDGMIIKTTNGGDLVPLTQLSNQTPYEYSLLQNYPNPFNPATVITFSIKAPGKGNLRQNVLIAVYDILGRKAAEIFNGSLAPGIYSINWNASGFSSGVYFYKLETQNYSETKKMIFIK